VIDNEKQEDYFGYEVLGNDIEAEIILKKYPSARIALIPDSPQVRFKLFNIYVKFTRNFESLISPNSIISKYSIIGIGTLVHEKVTIMPNVRIGDFVRLNRNTHVGNDVHISNYCTIAPETIIGGYSQISDFVYLGMNSTIVPQKTIGKNSIIGAGAVVTKDIPEGVVAKGNPARF
jgi:sugar O-acyltransferase (sialic acid O-acetyltransferase NeuD family)